MNYGQIADLLTEAAQDFYNKRLTNEILPTIVGQEINEDTVKKLIKPYLSNIKMPKVNLKHLQQTVLDVYSKDALQCIQRNTHMNDYDGSSVFSQENAEAVLVGFVNYACIPLDLALYTSDLKEKNG